jgi:hypothetical protein
MEEQKGQKSQKSIQMTLNDGIVATDVDPEYGHLIAHLVD